MKYKTEIINNKIVNYVAQLASFLKPGDIFCKPASKTRYKFDELHIQDGMVICENLETHRVEKIYSKSPVFKLVVI